MPFSIDLVWMHSKLSYQYTIWRWSFRQLVELEKSVDTRTWHDIATTSLFRLPHRVIPDRGAGYPWWVGRGARRAHRGPYLNFANEFKLKAYGPDQIKSGSGNEKLANLFFADELEHLCLDADGHPRNWSFSDHNWIWAQSTIPSSKKRRVSPWNDRMQ